MCEIFKKYITLNYLSIYIYIYIYTYIWCYIIIFDVIYVVAFTQLIKVSHRSVDFNSFSMIRFLQLYKDEVFMTCFMTCYFDKTLLSLIAQHWWQTMLILYQVIET